MTNTPKPKKGEISVNIADMTRDTFVSSLLIGQVTPNRVILDAETGQMDGMSILLECDHARAIAIRDVIRMKYDKNMFRFYDGTKRI